MRRIAFLIIFFTLIIFFLTPAYFLGYLAGPPGEQVVFVVEKGDNFAKIANRLASSGVIKSERALRWYVNFLKPANKLKRGEFGLTKNMPIPNVVYSLTEGKPMEYKVTIPEGYNIFQIAELLEEKGLSKKKDFLEATKVKEVIDLIPTLTKGEKKPDSIEGYVFPDTYQLQKVFTAKEIAQLMVTRFKVKYEELLAQAPVNPILEDLKMNAHQRIILASIVEKETGEPNERPLVAGLFMNRLKKRMKLQTDPTVIYGVWVKRGSWDGNIHRSDLDNYTEYNTYQIYGLPIGPIANPGINAIRAVLQPTPSDYLYFVSKNDGTHIFSKEYKDHQKAVQKTQLDPKAREGKSWRDLKQKTM